MYLNVLKSKTAGNFYFILTFLLLFFFFELNETFFYPPQSVHIWRQTNCLSLTQNYYQYNLPFFQPEMHNQLCDNGMSGKVLGEFPIIYYSVAQLWKLFGKHEWIFKFVQILILFFGLFALFHIVRKILGNQFLAGFISLLVFTSPMVVYFGPNFLPDVPALSFVFIAWYFVSRFIGNRRMINLWIASLFFGLAMLIKITSALSFVALGGWVIVELIFINKNRRIFEFNYKQFIPFILVLPIVISWYLFVEYSNSLHKGSISYHGIWPVWNMQKEQFLRIIDVLNKIYFKELFLPYTQYLTFCIWLYLIFIIKKLTPIFRFFTIVLAFGFFIQLMLWFQVLEGHDYYMINLLVVLVSVWTIFFSQINLLQSRFKVLLYALISIFFVFNVVTCKIRVKKRYAGWMNEWYEDHLKPLTTIEPLLKDLGIAEDDKIISIPDPSINSSLYYINRKGYTNYGSDFSTPDGFYRRIQDGAKYLVINDSTILSKTIIHPFSQKKIGQYLNISIYDIQNLSPPKQ
jgi:hypothetical protein